MSHPIPCSPRSVTIVLLVIFSLFMAPLWSLAAARPQSAKRPAQNTAAPAALTAQAPVAQPTPNAPSVVTIAANKDDSFTDADGDGKAEIGQVITYTVQITNSGDTDALNVQFSDTIDPKTTFVADSAHASPLARNDAYTTAIGNTLLEVSNSPSSTAPKVAVAGTLFDNDSIATGPDTIQLQSFQATSTNGGTVSVNANGSFTYLPAVNFTGTDTFTYTIRNSAINSLQDTATVTITVNGPKVWYVDNSGANGDGRSTSPFNTLTPVNGAGGAGDADAAGDIIYLFTGAANYTTGLIMENNQLLIGNGVALVVNTITLRAAGSRPTITNGSGNGITLATGNTLSGLNLGNASGFAIQGTSVGTLAVNNMAINTTGGGLDLTGVSTPTVNVVLDSITSSGGTRNVSLTGLNGTVTLGSGALSGTTAGATNHAFAVSGGNAAITYSGSITKATTGNVVNIASRTGGTIDLSGTINGSSSSGINASSNTGGTINFSGGTKTLNTGANAAVTLGTNTGTTINFSNGGLDIDTTSGAGFSATGGGTITVTTGANPNTIDSTTGTALSVQNTTIGGSGLTFRSISSNGAANGINLNNTGAGGLTVTGNGGTCTLATQTCTGGAILASTAEGIVLNSASAINLSLMKIQNSGTDGIHQTGGSGVTLTNSIVTDTAGATQQDGIEFDNVGGTITLTGIGVSGSPHDNIDFDNLNTNLTAFNLTGSTIQNTLAGTGANGILFVARGTSVITAATLTGNTISGSQSTGIQPAAQDTANIQNFIIGQTGAGNGNTISGNNAGIDANQSQAANITFRVVNNTFNTHRSQAINAFAATASTGGTMTGVIQSNIIGTPGTLDSGSAIGSGIRVVVKGGCVGSFNIDSNQVREVPNGRGIEATALRTASGSGGAKFKVTNNTVARPTDSNQAICGPTDPCPLASIWVAADNEVNNGNETVCSVVTGNTAYDPTSWANGGEAAYYLQENTFTGPSTHNTEGTNANVATQITNTNTVTNPGPGADVIVDGGVAVVAPGTCGTFPTQPVFSDETAAASDVNNEMSTDAPVKASADDTSITSRAFVSLPRPIEQPAQSAAKTSSIPTRLAKATAPSAPNASLPVNIGTLNPGKTVTIQFQVTVNSTFPAGSNSVSNQGTVSGSNFSSVLTNDPSTGTANDPTITPVDAVSLTIGDVMVAEGATGLRTVTVTVNLSQTTNAGAFTVHYQTNDNTATAPADYVAVPDTVLNIPGTALTATFTVQVKGDIIFEGNENFFVDLSQATGNAAIQDSQAVITIADDEPQVADLTGEGLTDAAVWNSNNGNWVVRDSATGIVSLAAADWGRAANGDIAVPGDYDGDNKIDIAIYRAPEGNWYVIKSSDATVRLQNWGTTGDIPVPGDYDADGKTDFAVWRPAEGNWYVLKSTGGSTVQSWGATGDKPVVGDFDGDGKTDLAVFRPSDGNWYVVKSGGGVTIKNWGLSTDKLVPGDYDGDGKTDLAVYRSGTWYILNSGGGTTVRNWGNPADLPVPGDYDGDGKFDIAIWRSAEGNWYVINSSTGAVSLLTIQVGGAGVIPVANAYLPQ